MTWVRFDDGYPWHPKIQPLNDRLFRLANAAVFWCAKNLTDGRIGRDQLTLLPTKTKPTPADAQALVARSIWHPAGHTCTSDQCPPPGPDGWVVHDYFEYQPSREKVKKDRAAKAARQARWMARRDGHRDNPADTPRDTHQDASADDAPYPPRPAPKEGGSGAPAAPAARRDAAGRPGGGEPEDQTPDATADPQPNGAMGVPPPPEAKAAIAQAIAAGKAKRSRPTGDRDPLEQLRELTPDLPALVETEPEAQ